MDDRQQASIGEGSVTQGRLTVDYGAVVGQDVVMVNDARVGERAVVPPRSIVTSTTKFQPLPQPDDAAAAQEEGASEDRPPEAAVGPWQLALWPALEANIPSVHYPPNAVMTYLLLPLRMLVQYGLMAVLPAITTVTTVCFAFYPTVLLHSYLPNVEVGPGWSLTASTCMLPLSALLLQFSLMFTTIVLHWLLYPLTAFATFRPWFMPYHLRRFLRVVRMLTNATVGEAMRGSALLPLYLSMLGCKCSPSAYINSLRITDPVSCEFGPEAVVDAEALIAPITTIFRDSGTRDGMIMVRRRARIHGRVGVGAVILGEASVVQGAEVKGGRVLSDGEVALPGMDDYVLADKLDKGPSMGVEEKKADEDMCV